MNIYEQFGIQGIINARSFSTKLGGTRLPDDVLEAMRQAAQCCVRMDELQDAASRVIAEATGAEAGVVTSGAAAALTLGTAACLAGFDVSRMNRLPDTAGIPCDVIVHRSHRNDYDHALRAAGARFVEVGFNYYTFPYEVEQAITENTAALYYQAGGDGHVMPLSDYAAIAHRHAKPVIVDAAAELPPENNLRAYIEAGADLVAFSGGKHLHGPQSTGILCGRSDLIFSAALQHQDMDVFPESWPLRSLIAEGKIAGPPHHGIGRGFKVGKEEIIGLMTALRRYPLRDVKAERTRWKADMELIVGAAKDLPGVDARIRFSSGRSVPHAVIYVDAGIAGIDANRVITSLQEGNPAIFVFEHSGNQGNVVFMPEALGAGEAEIVARRLREILLQDK